MNFSYVKYNIHATSAVLMQKKIILSGQLFSVCLDCFKFFALQNLSNIHNYYFNMNNVMLYTYLVLLYFDANYKIILPE